jgi:hypothetical protein
VACLLVPRAYVFPSFLLFAWWSPVLFLVRIHLISLPFSLCRTPDHHLEKQGIRLILVAIALLAIPVISP